MLISEISDFPPEFVEALQKKGYESLYPPQADAVGAGVLEGKNLVLATPTASGKTLVAMMAAMKAIERGGKVVYLAPLRALASEKYDEFKEILETLKRPGSKSKLRVFISTGDYDSSGESLGGGDLIILTNERFDSVMRHNVSWMNSVSLFIADEVHLVGTLTEGPTLEMILAKSMKLVPSAQILALSATISNTKDLAVVARRTRGNKLETGKTHRRNLRLRDAFIHRRRSEKACTIQPGCCDRRSDRCGKGRRPVVNLLRYAKEIGLGG